MDPLALMPNSGLAATLVVSRLGAALVLAGVIGLERELRGRPAGLRTHMLIGLAACLFTLIALEMVALPGTPGDERIRTDPLRLIEAVTAGVAFLAAGTILVAQDRAKGLTTGASMWLAGAIGLACGTGHVALAALSVALALVVLVVLRWLEGKNKH